MLLKKGGTFSPEKRKQKVTIHASRDTEPTKGEKDLERKS